MPNKHYMRGRRYENHVKQQYIKKGYTVVRSAGSKSPIDLIAINPQTKLICLIQCKKGRLTKPQAESALNAVKQFEGNYVVIGELSHSKTR